MSDSKRSQLKRVAEWIGTPIGDIQAAVLEEYASWLQAEAIPAGGLGPDEGRRLWDRHVCDSLAFAVGWPDEGPDAALEQDRLHAVNVRLDNVEAVQADVDHHREHYDGIVARGVMEPAALPNKVRHLLSPVGTLVIGLSRTIDEKQIPAGSRLERVPSEVLDGGAQILIIEPRERRN